MHLLAAGDVVRRPRRGLSQAEVFWLQGRRDEGSRRVDAAQALIADQPSLVLEGVCRRERLPFHRCSRATTRTRSGSGREALAMAKELGIDPSSDRMR